MDEFRVRKIANIYRASKKIAEYTNMYSKLRHSVGEHCEQMDGILDASELSTRVVRKEVRKEDVQNSVRFAVNRAPSLVRSVINYARKYNNAKA